MLPALHLRLGPAPPPRAEPTEGCREDLKTRKDWLEKRMAGILSNARMAFKSELGGENLKEYNRAERELWRVEKRLTLRMRKGGDCFFDNPLKKPSPYSAKVKKYVELPDRSSGLAAIQVEAVDLIKEEIRKEKGLGPGAELSDDDYKEANARFWKAVEEARRAKSGGRSR